jgi:hypothetical protein
MGCRVQNASSGRGGQYAKNNLYDESEDENQPATFIAKFSLFLD